LEQIAGLQVSLTEETESSTKSARFYFNFVIYSRVRHGKFCFFISSIENDEFNPRNGFILAELPLAGLVITPDINTSSSVKNSQLIPCKATYFMHLRFKYLVPEWISKQFERKISAALLSNFQSGKK
jgi:hypothetical protein